MEHSSEPYLGNVIPGLQRFRLHECHWLSHVCVQPLHPWGGRSNMRSGSLIKTMITHSEPLVEQLSSRSYNFSNALMSDLGSSRNNFLPTMCMYMWFPHVCKAAAFGWVNNKQLSVAPIMVSVSLQQFRENILIAAIKGCSRRDTWLHREEFGGCHQ